MTSGRWMWLGLAGALVLAAVYLPHLNVDQLVSSDAVTDLRVAAGVVALLIVVAVADSLLNAGERVRALGFALAAAALITAVYLPHLRAADAFGWLWGTAAEDPDKSDAVTWARWALVAIALLIAFVALRRLRLELGLVVLVALLVIAAVAATEDLLSRLDRPADVKKTEAAFDRGFAVPSDKMQQVTRDLKRDRCVIIVLVKPVDRDGDNDDDDDVPTYESVSYTARLISTLKAGKPSTPVEIELGRAAAPKQFASDLVTATASFISSTQTEQDAGSAADSGCP
jgi:hypothetical protein